MLRLTAVSKSYPATPPRQVLRQIYLQLQPGDYVAIRGESGVGKSTLLNLIAGLEQPDSGTIHIDGQNLATLDDRAATLLRRRHMGFVFQAFHVLPHLDVAENVALPLLLNAVPRQETRERVQAMIDAVGLSGRESSLPRELSGGEMQRVAIARALVHRPRLLLADEPTGNLDPDTAVEIQQLLRNAAKSARAAGILVTHSALAAATADRVLLLTSLGLHETTP